MFGTKGFVTFLEMKKILNGVSVVGRVEEIFGWPVRDGGDAPALLSHVLCFWLHLEPPPPPPSPLA